MNVKTYACGEYIIYASVISSFPLHIGADVDTLLYYTVGNTRQVAYYHGFDVFNIYMEGTSIDDYYLNVEFSIDNQLKVNLV
jgi:hypothetical protein